MLDRLKARASLLFLVVLTSCVPAKPAQTPTALQLATGAVVLTDDALALAIEASPSEAWKTYLVALEGVAEAVRTNEDLCAGPLGTLATVASVAKCTRCLQLVDVLEGQLACRK